MNKDKVLKVKNAMLAVQRYPWEQGVCAQALWEMGDKTTAIAMAHDAVLRQQPDGRLAVINANIAVTDPAANGEVVWRAYKETGDEKYKVAAEKMLDYLLNKAPRVKEEPNKDIDKDKGLICHNEVSFHESFSPDQIWVDSIYMAPPFLAVMGEIDEAITQIEGYMDYLYDEKTGLLFHIYDTGTKSYIRKLRWATGNGWALLGIARVLEIGKEMGYDNFTRLDNLKSKAIKLLDAMLPYQLEDGRFLDIMDDENSFPEGTGAMMMATFIYRGVVGGWLSEEYLPYADKVRETMEKYVDEYGIIQEVCGCPNFDKVGTSAESMAAYLMMYGWHERYGVEVMKRFAGLVRLQ